MLDFTSLAAVQFSDEKNKVFIRVFYQDGLLIKESCFDSDNIWYTMPDDIVARDAKLCTPIAATNWHGGKQVRCSDESSDSRGMANTYF
jgi:hypothetical protein